MSRFLVIILSGLVACWILALCLTGGFVLDVGGWRISSRNPKRLFIAYAAVVAVYAWRYGAARLTADLNPFAAAGRRMGVTGIVFLALMITILGLAFGTNIASGADAYGYVSQAELWRARSLHVSMPLAQHLPWPDADWSVAPLGYRPSTIPHYIVPTYAPGLPLMMVAASWIDSRAVYWVVPVLGGLLVWSSFLLGCALGGQKVGALTAVLMASSPVFVHHIVVPMSDVPAATFWTASMVLAMRNSAGAWTAAGLMAALATLVRPNTVVLALTPAALLVWDLVRVRVPRVESLRKAIGFVIGFAPGVILVALVNDHLYGSPFVSGYGELSHLFAWNHGWVNAKRFVLWFLRSETPLIVLAVIAPVILWREQGRRRAVSVAVATIGLVVLSYLFYLPFETWTFLRFLLPAIPFLLAFCAVTVITGLNRLPADARLPVAVVVVGAACVWRLDLARGALDFRHSEQRYVSAAKYVAERFPSNAVFLSMQHSGSLRHYSGRLTLRWDAIDPNWFDRSPEVLKSQGLDPYILVEDTEEADLRARLGTRTRLGALDWAPVADLPLSHRVRIYDPDDAGPRVTATDGSPPISFSPDRVPTPR